MGITKRTGGVQKGAQDHDEGQHGDKTREAIAKAWDQPMSDNSAGGANVGSHDGDTSGPRYDEAMREAHAPPSGSHLFNTSRTQHDEADLNAEKTRQVKDAEQHDHIAHDQWAERTARGAAKRKS